MFASVQIVGSAQDSVIGELRRTNGPGLGVKGPQVQILSSRRETAGQKPFRTKSEAASLLPCSNGVATAHVLTSPLLLRAVGRRRAHPPWRVAVNAAGDCDAGVPEYLRDGMQWHAGREHARGVPQAVQADTADAQSLGHGADRPQCLLGSTAVPLPVMNTRPSRTRSRPP